MIIGQLTRYNKGINFFYTWEIDGKELYFSSEANLINQEIFRIECVRKLRVLPKRMEDKLWVEILNTALANMKLIKE